MAAGEWGDFVCAVEADRAAVRIYRRLADEGRPLYDAVGRTATTLAQTLLRLGRLPEAEEWFTEAQLSLAAADRGNEGITRAQSVSGAPRSSLAEFVTVQLTPVRAARQVQPPRLAEYLDERRAALERVAIRGKREGAASGAWAQAAWHAGLLTWLAREHGGAATLDCLAEAGVLLGELAARAQRGGAAIHGWHTAADALRTATLADPNGADACGARYADQRIAALHHLMDAQIRSGETESATSTRAAAEAAVRDFDPDRTAEWEGHAAMTLETARAAGAFGPGPRTT